LGDENYYLHIQEKIGAHYKQRGVREKEVTNSNNGSNFLPRVGAHVRQKGDENLNGWSRCCR